MVLAQDLIVKKDQTEIQAKVTEVSENTIKYKKWSNREGPAYTISKTEVFMIIYENGEKELYQTTSTGIQEQPRNNKVPQTPTPVQNSATSSMSQAVTSVTAQTGGNKKSDDDAPKYKRIFRVVYGPSAVLESGDLGMGFGLMANFSLTGKTSGSGALEAELGLLGLQEGLETDNFETLNGVGQEETFGYAGVGYGIFATKTFKFSSGVGYYYRYGNTKTVEFVSAANGFIEEPVELNDSGVCYYGGIDIFFSGGFGINVRYDNMLGGQVGISFSF